MLTIAEQIRIIARRCNISLSELARQTGQTPQNLANKLKRNNFTTNELEKVATAAGLTLKIEWIGEDGNPIF